MLTVVAAQPSDPGVAALIDAHRAAARLHYAPEDCHAEDANDLAEAQTRMFAVEHGGQIIAIGGYKPLSKGVAEVKSVFVDPKARGLGAGKALMEHVMEAARRDAIATLMLEAGTDAYAAPARALYARLGFVTRPPFGAYRAAQASTFMECAL